MKDIGSKQEWLNIREINKSTCINKLMALEGAIEGVKKQMLSSDTNEDL